MCFKGSNLEVLTIKKPKELFFKKNYYAINFQLNQAIRCTLKDLLSTFNDFNIWYSHLVSSSFEEVMILMFLNLFDFERFPSLNF